MVIWSRKKMTVDDFAQGLAQGLGDQLVSVVLYGSAVSDEFVPGRSDQNMLVVVGDASIPSLKKILPVIAHWRRSGQPIPVVFTPDEMVRWAEDFPVEFLDMKEHHRVVRGRDVVTALPLEAAHLRRQVGNELEGKLLRLRRAYFGAGGARKDLLKIMASSVTSLLVLFRHVLRLCGEPPPVRKSDALALLARHCHLDAGVFDEIMDLKLGKTPPGDPDVLFDRYLKAVETVIGLVNGTLGGEHAR